MPSGVVYKRGGGVMEVDELRHVLLVSKCGGGKDELNLKRKVDLSILVTASTPMSAHSWGWKQ